MNHLVEKVFKEDIDHGSIAAALYIEGDGAPELVNESRAMLLLVRTQIFTVFMPQLQQIVETLNCEPGETLVDEQLALSLFGLDITLRVELKYDLEIAAPIKDMLHLILVESVGPEWSREATRQITARLKAKKFDDHYREQARCTILDSVSLGLGFGGDGGIIILAGSMLGDAVLFKDTDYTS